MFHKVHEGPGALKGRYTAAPGAQVTLAFEKQVIETKRIIAQGDHNSPGHWCRALRESGSGHQLALPPSLGIMPPSAGTVIGKEQGQRPTTRTCSKLFTLSLSFPQGQLRPCLALVSSSQCRKCVLLGSCALLGMPSSNRGLDAGVQDSGNSCFPCPAH